MKRIIAIAFSAILLFSCTKEIDLKLKNTEPQYVITGVVQAGDSVHYVSITQTVDFDQSNEFPKVSGAEVILSDGVGNSVALGEVSPGIYATVNFMAFEERTYTLSVKHDGKSFEAICAMPKLVPLDDVELLPNNFFGQKGFIMVPKYTDPADKINFYAFEYESQMVDEEKERRSSLILRDDEITNGNTNEQPLFEGFSLGFGDTVLLTMYGIAEPIYTFYFSKEQNTNPNSGAPANPVSNWSNGALGYFSARTIQKKLVIVPE